MTINQVQKTQKDNIAERLIGGEKKECLQIQKQHTNRGNYN